MRRQGEKKKTKGEFLSVLCLFRMRATTILYSFLSCESENTNEKDGTGLCKRKKKKNKKYM